jgi:sec-independent protein translocase protein TatA
MNIAAVFLLFNLGGGEILLILVATVVMFGSKRIPEIARGLGKGIREVRNATNDIKREIQKGIDEAESQVEQAIRVAEKPSEEVNDIQGAVTRKKPQAKHEPEQGSSADSAPNDNLNQEPQ